MCGIKREDVMLFQCAADGRTLLGDDGSALDQSCDSMGPIMPGYRWHAQKRLKEAESWYVRLVTK